MASRHWLSSLIFLSVVLPRAVADEGARFSEMRARAGVEHVNTSGSPEKLTILSSLGGGVALFDYDADSDLDLYFVNGMGFIDGVRVPAGPNRLYRNEGGWRFHEVTGQAGVGHEGWGVGVTVGDYDNDGLPDLYVTNIGANVLYRNRGDGTFAETTGLALVDEPSFGSSSAFFDADGDGFLDLYLVNYVDPDRELIPEPGSGPTCQWMGMPVMCGPRGLKGARDVFYRNRGDGRFEEATATAGLEDLSSAFGLGVVTGDYDDDGDADIYVSNDTMPNFLYRNDGRGRFTEVGLLSGVAYNVTGASEAGMGVDFGDPDGDGDLDLFVTNFSHETNTFYANSGAGFFTDLTEEVGLARPSLSRLGWATRFIDLDNDGDEDLFVANGHVYPTIGNVDPGATYSQKDQIFWNDGEGRFAGTDVLLAGATRPETPSRGGAFGDVDDDGDVDVVLVNIDEPPSLLRNDLASPVNWIGLRLIGRDANRDAVGARVELTTRKGTQLREVRRSGSILSANDVRLHFGLATSAEIDEIRIRWPGGPEQVLRDVPINGMLVVVEGVRAYLELGR